MPAVEVFNTESFLEFGLAEVVIGGQRVAGVERDADAVFFLDQVDDVGQLGEDVAQGGSLSGHRRQQGEDDAVIGQLDVDAVEGIGDGLHAWYDLGSVKVGYGINFTRCFYRPQPLLAPEEIWAGIRARESEGLLGETLCGG